MPLGRKHLRRSRDAPTGGIGHTQRTTSRLGFSPVEVNIPLDAEYPLPDSLPFRPTLDNPHLQVLAGLHSNLLYRRTFCQLLLQPRLHSRPFLIENAEVNRIPHPARTGDQVPA